MLDQNAHLDFDAYAGPKGHTLRGNYFMPGKASLRVYARSCRKLLAKCVFALACAVCEAGLLIAVVCGMVIGWYFCVVFGGRLL